MQPTAASSNVEEAIGGFCHVRKWGIGLPRNLDNNLFYLLKQSEALVVTAIPVYLTAFRV